MANASNSLMQGTKKVSFSAALSSDSMTKMMMSALGTRDAVTKFTTDIMAAYSATPMLRNCDPTSIVTAGLQCAAMKLSAVPALGEAWVVPYGDKATFQIGKNGLVQLAIRTGLYKDIGTMVIHDGEFKGRDKFTGKEIFEFIEDDGEREARPVVGYMAYFEMLNGFTKVVYFSKEKMLAWADRYSQAFNRDIYERWVANGCTGEGLTEGERRMTVGPWYGRFDSMGEKTVLRQLLQKWGAKSMELQKAIEHEIQQNGTDESYFEVQETEVTEPVKASAAEEKKEPEKKEEVPVMEPDRIEERKKPDARKPEPKKTAKNDPVDDFFS